MVAPMLPTGDSGAGGSPRRERVADRVATLLLDSILDGRHPPGSRLPPERDLASELGVNRTSLRQALGRLEHMGVVRAEQGRGTTVEDLRHCTDPVVLSHRLARDRSRMLNELFEVREALGGLTGRLAALRAVPDDINTLEVCLAELRAADGAAPRQRAELAFFSALVAATGNRPLEAIQDWVEQAYGDRVGIFTDAFTDAEEVVAGVQEVLDAVSDGDPVAAEAAVVGYARASATRMAAAVRGGPPGGPP